jgi:hypothetical protein
VVGVGIVEEQGELEVVQLAFQRLQFRIQLRGQLGILLSELRKLDQVAGPALQLVPDRCLVTVLGRFAGGSARPGRVVPGVR